MISFLEMFSWAVNPFGINESSNLFPKWKNSSSWASTGAKWAFEPLGNWD